MPNNEHLPVLLYRNVMHSQGDDAAAQFEQIFERNGWPAQWRNGVYDFHHYHSTAHEGARLRGRLSAADAGGPNGHEVTVHAGDIAVLPTGTGHCRLEESAEFLVVGRLSARSELGHLPQAPDAKATARMAALAFPGAAILWRARVGR